MRPELTVAMPVRNLAGQIPHALASIIGQTYSDWHLIVYDDGSTDDTAEVAAQFGDPRISVMRAENSRGIGVRLNEIIGNVQTPYFARMDGDDIAYPHRFEQQLAAMRADSALDLVGGGVLVVSESLDPVGVRMPPLEHRQICAAPWRGVPIVHPTYFGKTSWFRQHQYDPKWRLGQDQDLLLRSFSSSRFANVNAITLAYREVLSLKKSARSRRYFAHAVMRQYKKLGRPYVGVAAILEQCAKGALDGFAVSSGLGYRILRHRAQRAAVADLQAWNDVRAQVEKRIAMFRSDPTARAES